MKITSCSYDSHLQEYWHMRLNRSRVVTRDQGVIGSHQTLIIEAAVCRSMWPHAPKHLNPYQHYSENLKSQINLSF